jgi:hypothetical protein
MSGQDCPPWAVWAKNGAPTALPAIVLRLVGLDRRRPCWHCSKALFRVRTGPRKGQYVGAVIEDGGYERVVHVACAREMEEG